MKLHANVAAVLNLFLLLFTAGTPVRASSQQANNRPTGRQDRVKRLPCIIAGGNSCRYNERFARRETIIVNVTIYHNPRCSKSRKTLDLLRQRDIEPEVIDYLANPPDSSELAALLKKLEMGVTDILRTGEQDYRADREELAAMSEADLIEWLCQHPKVMQRPIVVVGQRARLGRPPEAVLEILS